MEPLYTFTIADPATFAAFIFFIITAVLVSNFGRAIAGGGAFPRGSGKNDRRRFMPSATSLLGVGTLDDVLWADSASRPASTLKVRGGGPACRRTVPVAVKAGYPPEDKRARS